MNENLDTNLDIDYFLVDDDDVTAGGMNVDVEVTETPFATQRTSSITGQKRKPDTEVNGTGKNGTGEAQTKIMRLNTRNNNQNGPSIKSTTSAVSGNNNNNNNGKSGNDTKDDVKDAGKMHEERGAENESGSSGRTRKELTWYINSIKRICPNIWNPHVFAIHGISTKQLNGKKDEFKKYLIEALKACSKTKGVKLKTDYIKIQSVKPVHDCIAVQYELKYLPTVMGRTDYNNIKKQIRQQFNQPDCKEVATKNITLVQTILKNKLSKIFPEDSASIKVFMGYYKIEALEKNINQIIITSTTQNFDEKQGSDAPLKPDKHAAGKLTNYFKLFQKMGKCLPDALLSITLEVEDPGDSLEACLWDLKLQAPLYFVRYSHERLKKKPTDGYYTMIHDNLKNSDNTNRIDEWNVADYEWYRTDECYRHIDIIYKLLNCENGKAKTEPGTNSEVWKPFAEIWDLTNCKSYKTGEHYHHGGIIYKLLDSEKAASEPGANQLVWKIFVKEKKIEFFEFHKLVKDYMNSRSSGFNPKLIPKIFIGVILKVPKKGNKSFKALRNMRQEETNSKDEKEVWEFLNQCKLEYNAVEEYALSVIIPKLVTQIKSLKGGEEQMLNFTHRYMDDNKGAMCLESNCPKKPVNEFSDQSRVGLQKENEKNEGVNKRNLAKKDFLASLIDNAKKKKKDEGAKAREDATRDAPCLVVEEQRKILNKIVNKAKVKWEEDKKRVEAKINALMALKLCEVLKDPNEFIEYERKKEINNIAKHILNDDWEKLKEIVSVVFKEGWDTLINDAEKNDIIMKLIYKYVPNAFVEEANFKKTYKYTIERKLSSIQSSNCIFDEHVRFGGRTIRVDRRNSVYISEKLVEAVHQFYANWKFVSRTTVDVMGDVRVIDYTKEKHGNLEPLQDVKHNLIARSHQQKNVNMLFNMQHEKNVNGNKTGLVDRRLLLDYKSPCDTYYVSTSVGICDNTNLAEKQRPIIKISVEDELSYNITANNALRVWEKKRRDRKIYKEIEEVIKKFILSHSDNNDTQQRLAADVINKEIKECIISVQNIAKKAFKDENNILKRLINLKNTSAITINTIKELVEDKMLACDYKLLATKRFFCGCWNKMKSVRFINTKYLSQKKEDVMANIRWTQIIYRNFYYFRLYDEEEKNYKYSEHELAVMWDKLRSTDNEMQFESLAFIIVDVSTPAVKKPKVISTINDIRFSYASAVAMASYEPGCSKTLEKCIKTFIDAPSKGQMNFLKFNDEGEECLKIGVDEIYKYLNEEEKDWLKNQKNRFDADTYCLKYDIQARSYLHKRGFFSQFCMENGTPHGLFTLLEEFPIFYELQIDGKIVGKDLKIFAAATVTSIRDICIP